MVEFFGLFKQEFCSFSIFIFNWVDKGLRRKVM